jgi:hypothetical protein
LDLNVGFEAPIREQEDIFRLESLGQTGDGAAVGFVGRRGLDAGRLPEHASEQAGEFAEEQPRPFALRRAFLAGFLAESIETTREAGRIETAGVRKFIDHRSAKWFQGFVRQS